MQTPSRNHMKFNTFNIEFFFFFFWVIPLHAHPIIVTSLGFGLMFCYKCGCNFKRRKICKSATKYIISFFKSQSINVTLVSDIVFCKRILKHFHWIISLYFIYYLLIEKVIQWSIRWLVLVWYYSSRYLILVIKKKVSSFSLHCYI